MTRFLTGSPTDKAVWMMIGGVAAIVVGLTDHRQPVRAAVVDQRNRARPR